MARRRMDVADLEIGMYVAELDRPWIESPFLFQGFVVQTADELELLRETCRYVYVDDDRREEDAEDRTIRLSINMRPQANPERGGAEWRRIAMEERRAGFERELQRMHAVREHARGYVKNLMQDVRFGRAIDTDRARQVVTEMVDTITAQPDAALWLTQLKQAHEYTAQHSINVAVLSIAFAAHLGYGPEQLKLIGLGALLHDVGKMRIPPSILDKPGRLTAQEFEVIKRHPVEGYEIVKGTGDVPPQSLEIIRYHHERVSGRGYPDGLRGDQISTAVLLTAICDVYDAITSDRVYHHGIPADQGLNAMYQMAPSDFGRELVQEFIKCVGIYPVGSLVELGNGAIGVVMTRDPLNRLRPVVMLLRDSRGRDYLPRRFVSLAAQAELDHERDWTVRRVVDARQIGIDMHALAADELLSGGHQVVHI
ncbi:MAG TPA: HD-GYP domain-containing protein [Gammaproteobacteria bacterium]|nr:HD-GYP domain-containing protein [Gammaproteobacteria bacterium]